MAPHEERRPDATSIETADDPGGDLKSGLAVAQVEDIPRCTHCGHVIWSDLSVMLGIGSECRRAS